MSVIFNVSGISFIQESILKTLHKYFSTKIDKHSTVVSHQLVTTLTGLFSLRVLINSKIVPGLQ